MKYVLILSQIDNTRKRRFLVYKVLYLAALKQPFLCASNPFVIAKRIAFWNGWDLNQNYFHKEVRTSFWGIVSRCRRPASRWCPGRPGRSWSRRPPCAASPCPPPPPAPSARPGCSSHGRRCNTAHAEWTVSGLNFDLYWKYIYNDNSSNTDQEYG